MTLCNWINKTGPKTAAKILDVDPSTISLWRNFRQLPSGKMMFKIHNATRGKVSYDGIITPYFKAQGAK